MTATRVVLWRHGETEWNADGRYQGQADVALNERGVAQPLAAAPYLAALQTADLPPGGRPAVLTIGGRAQRLVELFWPLAAEAAGVARPEAPPVFLALETAQ